MSPEQKELIRLRLSLHTGVDAGEIFPEAFFDERRRGAVVRSVIEGEHYPHINAAFVTRAGELVCLTQTGLN